MVPAWSLVLVLLAQEDTLQAMERETGTPIQHKTQPTIYLDVRCTRAMLDQNLRE